jgi:hypothetical protein
MRAAHHAPGDIRVEEVPNPGLESPTDALVRAPHAADLLADVLRGAVDLDGVLEGCAAMGEREAVKVLVEAAA